MKRWHYSIFVGLLVLPLLLAGTGAPTVVAQRNPPRNCQQLVGDAEENLVLNCANLPFDTACYGYVAAEASLADDPEHSLDEDFVSGAWTRLRTFASIRTLGMSVADAEWGLVDLSVQANIPRGLVEEFPTDPGVLFLMFGNVEVESAVPQDRLFIPVDDPLAVTTAASTGIKVAPSEAAETIGTVVEGITLLADGISPDGEWVRVAYKMKAGWVALADLVSVDVSGLPEIAEDSLSPMQSFYLRNGSATPGCNQALPDMLFLQAPENVEVDLIIDGLLVRLDSASVVVRVVGNALKIQVVSGMVTLYPDTPNAIIIPAGFSFFTCSLSEPEQLDGWDELPNDQVVTACVNGVPVPFTTRERQEIQGLERLPDNLFNYGFRIPRVTRASGVGGPVDRIEIPPDSPAYDEIIRNCELGRIPPEVCRHITGYTPPSG